MLSSKVCQLRLIFANARLLVLEELPPKLVVALAKLRKCTALTCALAARRTSPNKPVFVFIFDYIHRLPMCIHNTIEVKRGLYVF